MQKKHIKIFFLLGVALCMMLALTACNATPAIEASTPAISTAHTTCPTESTDLILFKNDKDGYCLLYPAENTIMPPRLIVINPSNSTADTPGDAWADIMVEPAADRTAAQVADSQITAVGAGFNITRSEFVVDGVPAIVVDGLPGPDPWRTVFIVSHNRLYTLHFLPWVPTNANAPLETLYLTVMETIHFLP